MFLIVEKGIRGRLCHATHRYTRTNNKYMKEERTKNKNKEPSYLEYWDLNNLYGWSLSQKFPVNNFKWVRDISEFNDDFIKNDFDFALMILMKKL